MSYGQDYGYNWGGVIATILRPIVRVVRDMWADRSPSGITVSSNDTRDYWSENGRRAPKHISPPSDGRDFWKEK